MHTKPDKDRLKNQVVVRMTDDEVATIKAHIDKNHPSLGFVLRGWVREHKDRANDSR